MEQQKLDNIVGRLLHFKNNPTTKKKGNDYTILAKFKIDDQNGEHLLIDKKTGKEYVSEQKMEQLIKEVHEENNKHRGRDHIHQTLREKYANINLKEVTSFLAKCGCKRKKTFAQVC